LRVGHSFFTLSSTIVSVPYPPIPLSGFTTGSGLFVFVEPLARPKKRKIAK
jgi:hypothetical protein